MAQPTVTQIKQRIVSLCQAIPGIITVLDAYPDDETPFTASQLPAIVVRVSWQTSIARESANAYLMTMPYIIELNAALSSSTTALVNESALEALEPWIITISTFFARRRRLELNDAGLAAGCDIPSLVASTRTVRSGVTYARLFFRLSVTTRHEI